MKLYSDSGLEYFVHTLEANDLYKHTHIYIPENYIDMTWLNRDIARMVRDKLVMIVVICAIQTEMHISVRAFQNISCDGELREVNCDESSTLFQYKLTKKLLGNDILNFINLNDILVKLSSLKQQMVGFNNINQN